LPQQHPAVVPAAPLPVAASPNFWWIGPGVDGVAASYGHWVCASYIYGVGDWSKHRWVFKDSVGRRSRDMPLSELLGVLDSAEKEKREFSAVVDLR
jgi:hypothetical protein